MRIRRKRLLAAILIGFGALPLTAQATNPEAGTPRMAVAMSVAGVPAAVEAAALAGNLDALSTMAVGYREGRSVERDLAKAVAYDRAITEGFANVTPRTPEADLVVAAILRLAESYRTGLPEAGLGRRPDLAVALLTHGASVFGDSEAQYRLGVALLEQAGNDAREARRAARWLLLAARKGHVEAQVALGTHLARQSSEASRLRGAHWLEAAARAEHAAASVSPVSAPR